ncbi:MAG: hypothetical protein CVU77_00835 [Elusimicrobia bacterium HGW-Elusimicrobia-1]|nr:MAG: hypothetical protein CVU77_00835 [Elusimicrobia bacterium HGW-Elusimicrobia-1]
MPLIHIAVVSFIFLVAAAVGAKIFDAVKISFDGEAEKWLFSVAAGLFVFVHFTALTAAAGLINRAVIAAFLAASAIAARRELSGLLRKLSDFAMRAAAGWRADAALKAVLLTAVVFNFFFACAPVTDSDALTYHFSFPKIFLAAGRLTDIPDNLLSYFPLNGQMMYTLFLSMGNDITAKLAGYSFGLLAAVMVYFFTARRVNAEMALPAAAIFYTMPVMVNAAGVGQIDTMYLCFSFMGLWALVKSIDTGERKWFWLCAVLTATSVTIKINNVMAVPPIAAAYIFYGLVERKKKNFAPAVDLGVFVLIFAGLICPWLIRNIRLTGHPFPFMNLPFIKAPPHEMYLAHMVSHTDGMTLARFARDIWYFFLGSPVIHPGPVLLIFAVPGFFMRGKGRAMNVMNFAAVSTFLLLYAALPMLKVESRYHLVTLAALSISAAYGFCAFEKYFSAVKLSRTILAAMLALSSVSLSVYFGGKRLPFVTGFQSREKYLDGNYGYHGVVRPEYRSAMKFINENVGRNGKAVFLGYYFVDAYYYKPRVEAAMPSFLGLTSMADAMRMLDKKGATHIVLIKYFYRENPDGAGYLNSWSGALDIKWDIDKARAAGFLRTVYSTKSFEVLQIAYGKEG